MFHPSWMRQSADASTKWLSQYITTELITVNEFYISEYDKANNGVNYFDFCMNVTRKVVAIIIMFSYCLVRPLSEIPRYLYFSLCSCHGIVSIKRLPSFSLYCSIFMSLVVRAINIKLGRTRLLRAEWIHKIIWPNDVVDQSHRSKMYKRVPFSNVNNDWRCGT